jgi:hypothetical protein
LSPGCAAVFCFGFFLAGSAFLYVIITHWLVPVWRANYAYVEHTCVVLDKRLVETEGDDGPVYRPEFLIRYAVDGRDYEIWTYEAARVSTNNRSGQQAVVEQFVVGRQYPCWYDPDDPGRAVLARGHPWLLYLFLLVPLAFVGFGAWGTRYFWSRRGKSLERLVAQVQPRGETWDDPDTVYPNVPDVDRSAQAGAVLAYRLRLSQSPGCVFLGLLFVTVFWNGITGVFVVFAVNSHLTGQPDWCLTFFISPLVIIGLSLVVLFFRQIVLSTVYRPPTAEVAAHPLTPGTTCRLWVGQNGVLRHRDFAVLVVCEEVARHASGESTHTDTTRVFEVRIPREERVTECAGDFTIPAGAMHSFKAANNEVQWKVVVQARGPLLLNATWEYPFVVCPGS